MDLLMPRHCPVCSRALYNKEEQLCSDCLLGMPLTFFWTQERSPMSDRFNEAVQEHILRDASPWEPYSHATALFFYRGEYKKLTREVKYKGNVKLGKYLGEALGRKLRLDNDFADVDMVVPVPLHFLRRLRRGYNQSGIIAEGLCSSINRERGWSQHQAELNPGILKRSRRTRSQVTLSGERKKTNIAGAFEADFSKCARVPHHILLVDDVFTSGSTLSECQHTLRKALQQWLGKEKAAEVKISAATLAYVGDC